MTRLISLLQLTSSIFEVSGVFLMANSLTTVKKIDLPVLLASALVRGDAARAEDLIPTIEKKTIALQGLSFIALGFLIQGISVVLSLLSTP